MRRVQVRVEEGDSEEDCLARKDEVSSTMMTGIHSLFFKYKDEVEEFMDEAGKGYASLVLNESPITHVPVSEVAFAIEKFWAYVSDHFQHWPQFNSVMDSTRP